MNQKEVGNRISELRNEKKMTQLQLSKLLSVDEKKVKKWEMGDEYPSVDLLPKLADTFEVSIDYLLKGEPKTQQKMLAGPPYSIYSYGRVHKYGIIDKVNEEYLAKGWRVVQSHITSAGEGEECILVVLEK